MSNYPKISQKDYDKAIGQFRLALNDVMFPLRRYGQEPYVDGAIPEIIELAEAFSQRCRGKDVPIVLKQKRNHR